MADGTTRVDLDDSRAVSSPEADNSPTTGSPQKLISDCSDLYDLINFHPSATTQLHNEGQREQDEYEEEEAKYEEKDFARKGSSPSPEAPPSRQFYIKRQRKSNSSFSSSSSTDSDGPDSDSGNYARSNGRPVYDNGPDHPPESPESAVDCSPDERATMTTTTTTTVSSVELLSPVDSNPGALHFAPELNNGVQRQITVVHHQQQQVTTSNTFMSMEKLNNKETIDQEEEEEEEEEQVQLPLVIVEDSDVVALDSSPVHDCLPSVVRDDDDDDHDHDVDYFRPSSQPNAIVDQPVFGQVLEHDPVAIDVTNVPSDDDDNDDDRHHQHQHEQLVLEEGLAEGDDVRSQNDLPNTDRLPNAEESDGAKEFQNEDTTPGLVETNQLVHSQVLSSATQLTHDNDVTTSESSSDSDSDYDADKKQCLESKKNKKKSANKKVVSESSTVISSSMVSTTKKSSGHEPIVDVKKTTTISSSSTSEVETLENGDKSENITKSPSSSSSSSSSVDESDDDVEKTTEVVRTGVSIAQLRASFSEHQRLAETSTKSKQVIDTGVDIKFLRASYRDLGDIEPPDQCSRNTSPIGYTQNKMSHQRTRSHGDLRKLEVSLSSDDEYDSPTFLPSVLMRAKSYSELSRYEEERLNAKEAIYTGVSVKALKSSFNSSESVRQNTDFDDVEGVKIDRAKVTRNFSQVEYPLYAMLDDSNLADEQAPMCRICGKQAFHMERIKAEKAVFHKSCFRCHECSKSLSVDTYCSHEGVLYCRPHFRQLFQPKAKFEEETITFPRRRHEMIIKENTPAELPPDVVRSADKPDYGLNEIPSLKNIKSRFEHGEEESHDGTNGSVTVHVKRSESIASRLAKFKSLESPENGHSNGRHHDSSESSNSSSDDDEDRDPQVVRETRKKDKVPTNEILVDVSQEEVVFSGMSDLKTQWESAGTSPTKEERAREIQDDLAKLRLRMCHGKGSLKAKYESACEESGKTPARSPQSIDVNGEIHANSLKEKFERGELVNEDEIEKVEKILKEKEDDLSVFKEQGTAADARHIFKEIDRSASSVQLSMSTTNVKRSPSMRSREILCYAQTSNIDGEIVRSSDKLDDDIKAPVDLSAKFKFFENYQDNQGTIEKKRFTITPPRDPVKEDSPEPQSAHDPNIVRACDRDDDIIVVTDTAKKMLDKFRQMESQAERSETIPSGPMKPLKRITPPREYTKEADDDEDQVDRNGDHDSLDGPQMSRNPDIVRCCDKVEDEFLIEARKAKNLKEKFERWEDSSSDRNNMYVDSENRKNVDDELLQQQQQPSPDMAKNLKAKFEAIREENIKSQERPKPKVNRFIDYGGNASDLCNICAKKVYPMEKLEVSGLKLHKTCFRCSQCNTILRMDNYTINGDCLYCSAHFKQLFKQCGNYDVGFGREQHKERWSRSRSSTPTSTNGHDMQIQYVNGLDNE